MKRAGIGVCAVLGVVSAFGVASCGGTSNKAPGGASDAGGPGEAVGGEPSHQAGSGGSESHSGGWGTGATLNVPGAAGLPSYAEGGGFYGGGGYPSEEPPCEPGDRSCDGPSVRLCDDDGAGTTIVQTCELAETCVAGSCEAIACAPGERSCRDGQVVECNDLGTDVSPIKTCKPDEYCIEQDGSALCNPTVCVANEPLCINQVATTCKADGSGPAPGGETCGGSAVCSGGECVDRLCTPGEKLCQHDDVYVCTSNGASATLFFECGADETCDPELAACRPRLCEPGKLGCDDTRIAKCNATGLGWEQQGTDCDDTDQICVNGSCKTQTCVPDSTFCKNYDVYQCDEHGVTSSLSHDCPNNTQHCAPYYTNTAYCTYNNCTPGAPMCSGNALSKCADDGSGVAPGGTDCGDQVCSNAACQPKVCTPGQYFCHEGDIAYCYDGVEYSMQQVCGNDASCGQEGNGFVCVAHACKPAAAACVANQVGTCASDGRSLASVTQNCANSGQICSSASSCGPTATDTLGISEELTTFGTDRLIGNIIDVTSNRELTLLEANLVLASPRSLRWVILEHITGYSYDVVYDKVLANQSGSGYLSSGPISYTLQAGHRYLIGVAVSGGGMAPYYDSAPFQPYLTFGTALGGYVTYYDSSLYVYGPEALVYDLRFTTESP